MTAKTARTGSSSPTVSADKRVSLSIWLLPSPEDPARRTLIRAIESFSQRPTASIPFPPHITLVGGIKCPSLDFFFEKMLPRLREGIAASAEPVSPTGNIACQFYPQPVSEATWNQACVLVMKESDDFTNLVELCREVVIDVLSPPGDDTEAMKKAQYPPPLSKAHLSLYYGTPEASPSPEEIMQQLGSQSQPLSFEANQLAIWRTEPASAEGVAQWEELAVINLPDRQNSHL